MNGKRCINMCTIEGKRKSDKNIFLHFHNEDDMFFGVKKIPISKYDYAVKLCGKENADFLYKVSKTTSDRDIVESFYAKAF